MHWPDILKPRPRSASAAPRSHALEQYIVDWTVLDASQVAEATGSRRVYLEVGKGSEKQVFQTVILDFDLTGNTLLLERFCPRLPAGRLFQTGQLRLLLDHPTRPLTLNCIALGECDYIPGAVSVKILGKTQQTTEPVEPVRFRAASAPSVEILIPMKGATKGTVTQMTPEDLEVEMLSREALPAVGERGTCRIRFSDAFELRTEVKIKAVKRLRKPHTHYRLRASFVPHNVDSDEGFSERLNAFLRMLAQDENAVHL